MKKRIQRMRKVEKEEENTNICTCTKDEENELEIMLEKTDSKKISNQEKKENHSKRCHFLKTKYQDRIFPSFSKWLYNPPLTAMPT